MNSILRSFKLKIALLSALISGVILILFAYLFISTAEQLGLERIDQELHALGNAQVRRFQPPEHWANFDKSLLSVHGGENKAAYAFEVLNRNNQLIYASAHWPSSLTGRELGITNASRSRAEPEEDTPGDVMNPRLAQFPPGARLRPGAALLQPPMTPKPPRFLTRLLDGRAWRIALMGNDEVTFIMGMDLSAFQLEIRRFRNKFLLATPPALLLLAVGGWLLAGQALRPIRTLTRVAGGITVKGLSQRVPHERSDHEFLGLIDVINGMLDRLERSFLQATRFSADAAHELRTPLTILQGQLEQAIQNAPTEAEQRTYAGLLEEVQRLKNIVRNLLTLAHADAGQLRLQQQRLPLTQEIETLSQDAVAMAPGLTIKTDLTPEIYVTADPSLLSQVFRNLLSNAIKYNGEQGVISLVVQSQGNQAIFKIGNTTLPGAHIDPARIFTRFYRGDKSRGRMVDGIGLGLSLAREIALVHGGDLILDELREGWISFSLTLPLAT